MVRFSTEASGLSVLQRVQTHTGAYVGSYLTSRNNSFLWDQEARLRMEIHVHLAIRLKRSRDNLESPLCLSRRTHGQLSFTTTTTTTVTTTTERLCRCRTISEELMITMAMDVTCNSIWGDRKPLRASNAEMQMHSCQNIKHLLFYFAFSITLSLPR
jgi:hypothetical protein